MWGQIKLIRKDRVLWLATLGNTYFFALAALLQFLIVIYAKDVLNISDPQQSSYLQAATAIGIGLGSFAAGYLSGGKIEYGLIPLGSIGHDGAGRVARAARAVLCHRGGGSCPCWVSSADFSSCPLPRLLQHRPDRESKGGVLAAANLLSFVGIFAASGVYYLVTVVLHLSPSTVFCSPRW